MNKLPNDPPVLLFELGNIQVFHYPTHYEKLSNAAPTAVYWQDSVTKTTYGPFMKYLRNDEPFHIPDLYV